MRLNNFLIIFISAFLLLSCSLDPEYKKPEIALPNFDKKDDLNKFFSDRWWLVFKDEILNRLEDEAIVKNHDLEAAMANIDAARAALGIKSSSLLPVVGINANTIRNKASKTSPFYFGNLGGMSMDYISNYTLGVGVSYEIDFFGKYRSLEKAARHEFFASMMASDIVLLSVTSQIAKLHFSILLLQNQLAIMRRIYEISKELERKYYVMKKNGYCHDTEYLAIRIKQEGYNANVIDLESQLEKAYNALGCLIGRSPLEMMHPISVLSFAPPAEVPNLIPNNIPSDILLRRPDIAQAEQMLIASNANIGAARAAFFPSISLTGTFGYDSKKLRTLIRSNSDKWEFTSGINIPIFQGGRLVSNLRLAKAQYKTAEIAYKKTVKNAFKEVLDVLTINRSSREILIARKKQFDDALRLYEIAKEKKGDGLIASIDLFEAEQQLLMSKSAFVEAKYARFLAIVDLCKTFGGGWRSTNCLPLR